MEVTVGTSSDACPQELVPPMLENGGTPVWRELGARPCLDPTSGRDELGAGFWRPEVAAAGPRVRVWKICRET